METDFLVLGSGIAGLTFAVEAANYGKVVVITKKERAETNTNYAQGGIAAAVEKEDSPEKHLKDTIRVGDGLCEENVVKLMVSEAPRIINKLIEYGVDFTKKQDGELDLGMEGGHSARRIVHTNDTTGAQIENALLHKITSVGVNLFEDWFAIDLMLKDDACIGVWAFDIRNKKILPIFSKITMIATGGIGRTYLHTTNPPIATGDGIAMAYRAGANVANMEFVQFHPTTLYGKQINNRALLLSEAIRGEGGILKTSRGDTFMEKYDSQKDLAPRDIVARAINSELKDTNTDYVLLDVTHIGEKFSKRFPYIYENCKLLGIDPVKEPIPVVPAAHYICGGILVDIEGKTNITNLYAAGEASCTGVHGANRLASNSLLESIVFGFYSAKSAAKTYQNLEDSYLKKEGNEYPLNASEKCDDKLINKYFPEIRSMMWEKVGIVRNTKDLQTALSELEKYKTVIDALFDKCEFTYELAELRNLVTIAFLVTKCAIERKESRGLHYNTDYTKKDDSHYRKNTIINRYKLV